MHPPRSFCERTLQQDRASVRRPPRLDEEPERRSQFAGVAGLEVSDDQNVRVASRLAPALALRRMRRSAHPPTSPGRCSRLPVVEPQASRCPLRSVMPRTRPQCQPAGRRRACRAGSVRAAGAWTVPCRDSRGSVHPAPRRPRRGPTTRPSIRARGRRETERVVPSGVQNGDQSYPGCAPAVMPCRRSRQR